MMGPLPTTHGFEPGALVSIKKDHLGSFQFDRFYDQIGTIIEMYVNANISTGAREEKALVMWNSGDVVWISIRVLRIVS